MEILMETRIISAEPIIKFIKIPSLISAYSCGFGNPYDDGYDFYEIPESSAKKAKSAYVIEATGNSLEPSIKPGDKLLVDHDKEPKSGDIIVVHYNGEFLVKHFKPVNGTILLVSENMDFDPIIVNDNDQFQILGVVVNKINSLRKNIK